MPTCWFCGADVPRLHICVKCEQEFCDQHIHTASHDCAGVPVPNPFSIGTSASPPRPVTGGTRFQCWFCGTISPETGQCPKCKQRFCASHLKPETHDCLGEFIPNPLEFSMAYSDAGDPNIEMPPELLIFREGKIKLDSQRAERFAATIMEAYRKCVEEPGKTSEVDPELGEIYLLNPNVLWLINSHALDQRYAEKLNQDPLARNLLKWLKAFGSRLEFIQQISEDLQIPVKELTLQQLIHYHLSYLTDFSQFFSKMAAIQANFAGMPVPEVAIIGTVNFTEQSLVEFTERAYRNGEREIGGYLVGTRDDNGKITSVRRFVPLQPADSASIQAGEYLDADPMLLDFFSIMQSVVDAGEVIVGFMHSRPQGPFPTNTREDAATHLKEKVFASIFQPNLPLPPSDKIHIISHLSRFNFLQISFMLVAMEVSRNEQDVFDHVITAIMQYDPNHWQELSNQLEFLIGPLQNVGNTQEFHLVPYLSVIVAPVMRFVSVLDYHFEKPGQDQRPPAISEVFFKIEIS